MAGRGRSNGLDEEPRSAVPPPSWLWSSWRLGSGAVNDKDEEEDEETSIPSSFRRFCLLLPEEEVE